MSFVVVQDSDGVVGVFPSAAGAAEALAGFGSAPLLGTRWPGDPEVEHVWVVPYARANAVAFAATDRDAAAKTQKAYARCDLVETDDLKYFRLKMGRVIDAARRRLVALEASYAAARQSAADGAAAAENPQELAAARFLEGFKPAEVTSEARINIFEGVTAAPLGEAD